MKTMLTWLLLPLVIFGCSKKPLAGNSPAAVAPTVRFVQSSEAKEMNDLRVQASGMLEKEDYEQLESLADKLRSSKDRYPNGVWKLFTVYAGLDFDVRDTNALFEARQKQLENWIDAKPDSIMARIAMARLLTSYAWKARGGDTADKVNDAGWRIFFDRLHKALAVLDKAKTLKEKCPAYWLALQNVALGMQFDKAKYQEFFQQAIAQEPDCTELYSARATYLLPRWYGKEGEWEQDLTQSADRIGGEAGDLLYAQVAWSLQSYTGSGSFFEVNKLSWERIERGFAILVKQYPDSVFAWNQRAHLAALAGDKAKAQEYFLHTRGEVDLASWNAKGEFDEVFAWTFSP